MSNEYSSNKINNYFKETNLSANQKTHYNRKGNKRNFTAFILYFVFLQFVIFVSLIYCFVSQFHQLVICQFYFSWDVRMEHLMYVQLQSSLHVYIYQFPCFPKYMRESSFSFLSIFFWFILNACNMVSKKNILLLHLCFSYHFRF